MSNRGKSFGPRNKSKGGYYNHPFHNRNQDHGDRNHRTVLHGDSSRAGFGARYQGIKHFPYDNRYDPINDLIRDNPIPRGRHYRNKRGGKSHNRPRAVGHNQDNTTWYKITIPFGKKLTKDFILKSLASLSSTPFNPINYQNIGQTAVFYVDNEAASNALRQCSRRISSPDGPKVMLHISNSAPPATSLIPENIDKIKLIMSSRFDTETKSLNLQNFHTDAALKAEGLHAPLARLNVITQVVKIITENIPQLQSLDLSQNRLSGLTGFGPLVSTCKNLKSLNLRNNILNNMSDLNDLKGIGIEEVILDGNPLCDHYKDQTVYISDVRNKFPKVIKLDGKDLPPPILFDLGTSEVLPELKGSYFPSPEVSSNVLQFLETYFGIYDSANRQPLLEAYHEDCVYSLQVAKHPTRQIDSKVLSEYLYDHGNRNLLKLSSDPTAQEKTLRQGRVAVVSQLCSLPKTEHFANSITIDVSHLSSSLMMFSVSGIFKEVDFRNSSLKTFTRNFLVVPHENGIHIINEMHTVAAASGTQAKAHRLSTTPPAPAAPVVAALPVSPVISSSPMNGGILTEEMKQHLVIQMASLSRMNIPFSTKCLEEQNWDLQGAMAIFTDLNRQGGIPPEAFL